MTTTKERPILFSGEMVRAILSGRKTQTRRIVKPQPAKWIDRYVPSMSPRHWLPQGVFLSDPSGVLGKGALEIRGNDTPVKCPYEVGTRLWIKTGYETRYDAHFDQTFWQIPPRGLFTVTHGKATSKSGRAKRDGGHPGRFMPHWLSMELRLPVLEITDIRVQRLQEISHHDALAEGCENTTHASAPLLLRKQPLTVAQLCYSHLWDSINTKPGTQWAANPWVWAITFKRMEDR